jgi:hypothetical protein
MPLSEDVAMTWILERMNEMDQGKVDEGGDSTRVVEQEEIEGAVSLGGIRAHQQVRQMATMTGSLSQSQSLSLGGIAVAGAAAGSEELIQGPGVGMGVGMGTGMGTGMGRNIMTPLPGVSALPTMHSSATSIGIGLGIGNPSHSDTYYNQMSFPSPLGTTGPQGIAGAAPLSYTAIISNDDPRNSISIEKKEEVRMHITITRSFFQNCFYAFFGFSFIISS